LVSFPGRLRATWRQINETQQPAQSESDKLRKSGDETAEKRNLQRLGTKIEAASQHRPPLEKASNPWTRRVRA
jgi:hypothetical protein